MGGLARTTAKITNATKDFELGAKMFAWQFGLDSCLKSNKLSV